MASQEHEGAAMLLMMRAMMAGEAGDYGEAAQLLTEALQIAPLNGEIYHNRGLAYSRMQRWREALPDFNRALALDPHPSSFEQRSLVYYQLKDLPAAIQDLQAVLQIDSQNTFALVHLAWFCIEDGRYKEAIDYCSQAIAIEQTSASAHAHRAQAYLRIGDKERAFADFQKAKHLVESRQDTSDASVLIQLLERSIRIS